MGVAEGGACHSWPAPRGWSFGFDHDREPRTFLAPSPRVLRVRRDNTCHELHQPWIPGGTRACLLLQRRFAPAGRTAQYPESPSRRQAHTHITSVYTSRYAHSDIMSVWATVSSGPWHQSPRQQTSHRAAGIHDDGSGFISMRPSLGQICMSKTEATSATEVALLDPAIFKVGDQVTNHDCHIGENPRQPVNADSASRVRCNHDAVLPYAVVHEHLHSHER